MHEITPDEKLFTEELKKRVAKSLKMVMVEFDMSGVGLANLTGFDATYISHLRSGKKLPNFENFIILLESMPEDAQDYFLDLLLKKNVTSKVSEKHNQYKV